MRRISLSAALVGAVLIANVTQAVTVSYTDTLNLNGDYNPHDPFNLPQFNPAWGTLNSVAVDAFASAYRWLDLTNNGISTAYLYAVASMSVTIRYDATALASNSGSWQTPHYGLPGMEGMEPVAPGQTYSFNCGPLVIDQDFLLTEAADLARFTGTGTAPLQGMVGGGAGYGAIGGRIARAEGASSTWVMTVTYNYDVPEPAPFLLVAPAGAALLRRPRNKAQ